MKFIAVDLELNQPSNKIIQLGASAFDTDVGEIAKFNEYCDPGEPINWGYKCSETQTLGELLGPKFPRDTHMQPCTIYVLRRFWKWCKDNELGKKFVQWGGGDMEIIFKECRGHNVRYPNHIYPINVKQMYKYVWQPASKFPKAHGLQSASHCMNSKFLGQAHNAADDAFNTGWVFMKMYNEVAALAELKKKL